MDARITPEYLAGVIDCYATFQDRRHEGKGFQLRVTMPSREVMDLLKDRYGGTVEDRGGSLKLNWYDRYVIKSVLMYCLPHLIAKRQQADWFVSQIGG